MQNDLDITNLDPANRSGWYDEMVMFAIYSGLCQYKPGTEWGWQLDAAQSLEQVDPLTIRFALRPGIQWTGGFGEMTAEDVKYSYERFLNKELAAIYASDWEALDHVEVTGKYEGIIHLKHPFAPLFTSTLPHASGLIVCKKALEATQDKKIGTAPAACSGPYKIGDWQPRERLTLVRNEGWNGRRSEYDQIQLVPIGDLNTAQIAFEAGDLDMTKINISAIGKYRDDPGDNTLTVRPALAYTWLGMNIDHPKLKDVQVRRAIQQAIDVPGILDATFGGAVKPAYGLVPPPLAGARSKNIYPYDPAQSKALLKKAGVAGLQLRLDLSTSTDGGTVAQVIQAEVGIDLKINQMDGAAFVAAGQESEGEAWKDSQLRLTTFTTAPDASWVTAWFTCDQVGIWNTQRTCDKKWDALNAAAAVVSISVEF